MRGHNRNNKTYFRIIIKYSSCLKHCATALIKTPSLFSEIKLYTDLPKLQIPGIKILRCSDVVVYHFNE